MDCVFCKIGGKEIPAEIVFENEESFAILDIHPVAPGHTMVIPKGHAQNLLDLPRAEVKPLFEDLKTVLHKISSALRPDGFTIGINQGSISGQVVDHLHIHIIPRFVGDSGGSVHSVVQNPPAESLAEIAAKIRAAD
ncbi:MAG: Hit-like protein involved in cell-cycle regulation [Parcubacteria group bacterium LiPW_15]|nr:MAG: Hit-like protein involved in cell-cycle regulation [Parcubacteria group bacterium LiPW_15]